MKWELDLIVIYCTVSDAFDNNEYDLESRILYNQVLKFTDQELISIFIFGIYCGFKNIKTIHRFAQNQLKQYFPNLMSYKQFVKRWNNLEGVFPTFCQLLVEKMGSNDNSFEILIDSLPIIASKNTFKKSRRLDGIADKGYSASKNCYYYGVKFHVLGARNPGSIPTIAQGEITQASVHDLNYFKGIAHLIWEKLVFGDKAYADCQMQDDLALNQGTLVETPIKKPKGRELSFFEKLLSEEVSSIRQPIESLFSQLNEKTKIQDASKVRSKKGLISHVYGRFTAFLALKFCGLCQI